MLELLFLDLLGENRLENQSERVLASFSCPPAANVDDVTKEGEVSSPSPEKPNVFGFFGPPLAAVSTSAGAEDGARSRRSPLAAAAAAGARPSGVECGARTPRFRTILKTCREGRDRVFLIPVPQWCFEIEK